MTAEQMTRADRETLVKIARQRERVAKTEAKERAAHLMADFEAQLDRRYRFDENEVWDAAAKAAEEAVQGAKRLINEECERLGIPADCRPGLSMGWHDRGRNTVKEQRAEMRRVAQRQVEAAERSARAAIERKSLEVQESIMVTGLTSDAARAMLASMPGADALMPMLSVDGVAGLIASEKRERGY